LERLNVLWQTWHLKTASKFNPFPENENFCAGDSQIDTVCYNSVATTDSRSSVTLTEVLDAETTEPLNVTKLVERLQEIVP